MSCLPQCSIVTLTQPAQNVLSTAVANSLLSRTVYLRCFREVAKCVEGFSRSGHKTPQDVCVSSSQVSAPQLPVT